MSLTLIIILLLAGFLLMFAELFVPGGILGTIGGALAVTGLCGIFIEYGAGPGLLVTFASLLGTIIVFYTWLKLFPKTRMGRAFLPKAPPNWVGYDDSHNNMLGKHGVCHTPLRPCGIADFQGQKVDVVTYGDFLDAGTEVVVTETEGNRIVVEPTTTQTIGT